MAVFVSAIALHAHLPIIDNRHADQHFAGREAQPSAFVRRLARIKMAFDHVCCWRHQQRQSLKDRRYHLDHRLPAYMLQPAGHLLPIVVRSAKAGVPEAGFDPVIPGFCPERGIQEVIGAIAIGSRW